MFNKFGKMSSNPMNQSFMSYRGSVPNTNTKLGRNTQQNAQTTVVPKMGKIKKKTPITL